jgi:hypothetical protein
MKGGGVRLNSYPPPPHHHLSLTCSREEARFAEFASNVGDLTSQLKQLRTGKDEKMSYFSLRG